MTVKLICGAELLHIPKTGGSWVTSVLQENCLIAQKIGHKHADFDRNLLRPAEKTRQHLVAAGETARRRLLQRINRYAGPRPPFRFCFVRHPLSWYESWWKYMNGRGWDHWGEQNSALNWHPNSILNDLGSSDFNQFVRNVVQVRPGYVSELYFSYTKPGIGFIGKTETLRDDLCRVLDHLGLAYSKDTIFNSERKNVSKTAASQVSWDPELRSLVTKLEISSLIHFDYLTEQEQQELGLDGELRPSGALQRFSDPYKKAG